ncbi:MAG TPA: WbqC family protein [Ferruginibacter sp.]|nr:WbqC family protein [Ferruginibacter sp.]
MINLIDNQYLGSLIYYKSLYSSKYIELEAYDRHQKSGFSNRCYIAGANGLITLSIPLLKGRNQKSLVNEIEIDNQQKWQIKHWRAMESSYMRSPWFEFYKDDLKQFYEKEYRYLFEWNKDLFIYILKKIDWNGELSLTSDYEQIPADKIDIRNTILPKNYLLFPVIKYPQVFEEKLGFLPNLSIIDLLFCCGKNANSYLI